MVLLATLGSAAVLLTVVAASGAWLAAVVWDLGLLSPKSKGYLYLDW